MTLSANLFKTPKVIESLRFDFGMFGPYVPAVINVLSAIGIFILGWMLSRWASNAIKNRLANNVGLEVNATLRPIIASVVRYAILVATIYAALTIAGIPASSLLAVLGAAGLAIALAVQGTLSNIAAGIMLIFLKVFKVGEYIESPIADGTVLELGLFVTQIQRPDGVLTIIPNAQLWGAKVNNLSRHTIRRVDISIDIARDNDLEAALSLLVGELNASDLIAEPELTSVIISGFTPSAATIQARCWLQGATYRADGSTVRALLHKALISSGIKMPPPVPIVMPAIV
jgi:small conductance mechanosensitive channel